MKKKSAPVFIFIALLIIVTAAGCSNDPGSGHTHKFAFDESKWESDETGHWHLAKCECGEEKKVSADSHTWGKTTETLGTCVEPGSKSASCTVCGYTKTESIKIHSFNEETVPKCTLCRGYKCGDNVAAVYDAMTKTLTVTGTGPMDDAYTASHLPWKSDDIVSVIIEDGVTKVSKSAFENLDTITSVKLGKDVEELGEDCFRCTLISSIILPEGLKKIGDYAFWCTEITELNIPSKVKISNAECFHIGGSLTAVNVDPENATALSIDGVVYSKDKSTLIYVPSEKKNCTIATGTSRIGDYAFFRWNGTEIEIPSGVTEIGTGAFESSTLANVTFKEGLKTIGEYAFSDCKIKTAILPSTVETIGVRAFSSSSLEVITIGSAIKSIGENAFYYCVGITITINRPSSERETLDTTKDNWGATNATVVWSDS